MIVDYKPAKLLLGIIIGLIVLLLGIKEAKAGSLQVEVSKTINKHVTL